jgi:hypothetical protein
MPLHRRQRRLHLAAGELERLEEAPVARHHEAALPGLHILVDRKQPVHLQPCAVTVVHCVAQRAALLELRSEKLAKQEQDQWDGCQREHAEESRGRGRFVGRMSRSALHQPS